MYVAPVIEYLSLFGGEQGYDTLEQYGLTRTAAANDKVGLSLLEGGVDAVKYLLVFKVLVYVDKGNHVMGIGFRVRGYEFSLSPSLSSSLHQLQTQPIRRFVSSRSVNNMSTLLTTTELVPAFPTSMLPPCTV